MKPSITPLIACYTALKASEDAERRGDLDAAYHTAIEAQNAVEAWANSLWKCRIEKKTLDAKK